MVLLMRIQTQGFFSVFAEIDFDPEQRSCDRVFGGEGGGRNYLARLLPLSANLPGNSRAQLPGASGRGAVQPARVI